MAPKCCVPGCKSNYKSSRSNYVSVFRFPKDSNLFDVWLKNIDRPNWRPALNSVVCVHHFEEECVDRMDKYRNSTGELVYFPRSRISLKPNAIPTIFPARLKEHKTDNDRLKTDGEAIQEEDESSFPSFDSSSVDFDNPSPPCSAERNDIELEATMSTWADLTKTKLMGFDIRTRTCLMNHIDNLLFRATMKMFDEVEQTEAECDTTVKPPGCADIQVKEEIIDIEEHEVSLDT